MTAKTYPNASMAPDGSSYVTLTDGAGNLVVTNASSATVPVSSSGTSGVRFGNDAANTPAVVLDNGTTTWTIDYSGNTLRFVYNAATIPFSISGNGTVVTTNVSVADTGYGYFQPTTGQTVTLSNTVYHNIIDPAGTLANLTVNLPATPTDGMVVDIRFSQVITALVVSGNGHSVLGNPTTATLGSVLTAIYKVSNTTWYM